MLRRAGTRQVYSRHTLDPGLWHAPRFLRNHLLGMSYDLAPDGKRFALLQPGDSGALAEYRVVLNWIEDVKARVGSKK